jgi:anti-sigma regulatory factor (Ser/Thr protein kinase)
MHHTLPKKLGSERLDTVIETLSEMRENSKLHLSWAKVEEVEPAGHAIIAILIDQAIEKKCLLIHSNLHSTLEKKYPLLNKQFKEDGLPNPHKHFYKEKSSFHICCEGGINLQYKEILINEYSHLLDEDLLFSIQLVFNELIQNAVDHSTSERYYLYFGVVKDEVHFGVLDMGITLPSKMEQKFNAENDIEFLELSLKEGITTRRLRTGGLGLFHTLEMIKEMGGKFVFISRDGQIRRYFSQRKVNRLKLKSRLHGTWVMFTFKIKGHIK